MARALKSFRYALAASIVSYILALMIGGFWPAILSIAAMVICSIGCLALQMTMLFRRPG